MIPVWRHLRLSLVQRAILRHCDGKIKEAFDRRFACASQEQAETAMREVTEAMEDRDAQVLSWARSSLGYSAAEVLTWRKMGRASTLEIIALPGGFNG